MLADVHRLLAILVAAGGVAVALVVVIGAVTHRPVRFARDRAILAAIGVVAIGAATGLVILIGGGRPNDALHLLYGAIALLILPVVRFWDRLARRRGLAVGIGGVILSLLVLRLFQTG